MQQLHCFDELRNNQGVILNRSATIDTRNKFNRFIGPHHISVFDFFD
jgi:hypothetical protein